MTHRLVGINEKGLRVGEDHQRATLTDADIERMRELRLVEQWTYSRIAEKFEISRRHVRDIVNFKKRVTTPVGWRTVK